jgi:hypothetical protein
MPRKKFSEKQLKFYANCDCYTCPGPLIAEDALKYRARIKHLLKYLRIANLEIAQLREQLAVVLERESHAVVQWHTFEIQLAAAEAMIAYYEDAKSAEIHRGALSDTEAE